MIPIRFEYIDEMFGIRDRKYVTILGYHKHHYTGKQFIRIREEYESGHIQEYMVTEEAMKLMLSKRVGVSE